MTRKSRSLGVRMPAHAAPCEGGRGGRRRRWRQREGGGEGRGHCRPLAWVGEGLVVGEGFSRGSISRTAPRRARGQRPSSPPSRSPPAAPTPTRKRNTCTKRNTHARRLLHPRRRGDAARLTRKRNTCGKRNTCLRHRSPPPPSRRPPPLGRPRPDRRGVRPGSPDRGQGEGSGREVRARGGRDAGRGATARRMAQLVPVQPRQGLREALCHVEQPGHRASLQ